MATRLKVKHRKRFLDKKKAYEAKPKRNTHKVKVSRSIKAKIKKANPMV